MLELELFQCLNRQLGYAGRLGVVAVELPLPARGSQTVGANCDHAFWFCPFGFQLVSARKTSARVPTLRAELFQRNLATSEI